MAPRSSSTTTTTTDATSRLATLPEEILSHVACCLASDDLFNLRITCRDVEAKVLHDFATQFIATKCFIFSSESLKALSNIASSTKLCHYLKHVYLLTAHFPGSRPDCCPVLSSRQKRAYAAYASDQRALQEQGGDSKSLVQAFKQLPSLRTLMLVDHVRLLPEDCHCHGINTFRRKTGYHDMSTCPPPDEFGYSQELTQTYYEWLSHVFKTMTLAVAETGIATITRFGTDSISKSSAGQYGLSPLLDLKFQSAAVTKLIGAFASLEKFELQLRSLSLPPEKQNSAGDAACAVRRVSKFTQALRSITRLDLSFDGSPQSGDVCTSMLKGVQLSKLTSLRLHGVSVGCIALAKAVCELSSARDVAFETVDLFDGSWKTILQALEKLPVLDHLHMFYSTAAGQKVFFLEHPELADPMSDYLFGDPAAAGAGNAEDTDDESENDQEPPELLPMDKEAREESHDSEARDYSDSSSVVAQASVATEDAPPSSRCKFYRGPDFKDCVHSRERGYFICLQDDEIRAQIPKFLNEYNVAGEDQLADLFGMLGAGGANMPVGGLLGAMPLATPAAGAAAAVNPNATNPAAAQTLQTTLTQLGGLFQGAGAGPNGAALFTGPLPAGWGAQGAPLPFGQFFQGLGPNGGLQPVPPASNDVLQGAGTAAVPALQQDDVDEEVPDHGAMDDVE